MRGRDTMCIDDHQRPIEQVVFCVDLAFTCSSGRNVGNGEQPATTHTSGTSDRPVTEHYSAKRGEKGGPIVLLSDLGPLRQNPHVCLPTARFRTFASHMSALEILR